MKKILNIFLFILIIACNIHNANAYNANECLKEISESATFKSAMFDLFPNTNDLNDDNVLEKREDILQTIASQIASTCIKQIPTMLKKETHQIPYNRDNKKYVFEFKPNDLSRHYPIKHAIFLYNNFLAIGETIKRTDLLKGKDKFKPYWSGGCQAMAGYTKSMWGGNVLPDDRNHVFPGVLINYDADLIASDSNIHSTIETTKNLAHALSNSNCRSQRLVFYVVLIKDRDQNSYLNNGSIDAPKSSEIMIISEPYYIDK